MEQIHNSPEASMGGLVHSTPRLLEVMVFPEGNRAEIDWYVRMPTDPPPGDTKIGKLLRQCVEEDATLGPTFPMINSQFPHCN